MSAGRKQYRRYIKLLLAFVLLIVQTRSPILSMPLKHDFPKMTMQSPGADLGAVLAGTSHQKSNELMNKQNDDWDVHHATIKPYL